MPNPPHETRRQHYLPFAYLNHFRCDPAISNRTSSTIFRDTGQSVVQERVANQCYQNWYYRRTNTQESESGFGSFESDWNQVLLRARSGQIDHALCVLQLVMYHFRNISIQYQIETEDRFQAVQNAVVGFVEQRILRLPHGEHMTDNPDHVLRFPWEVSLIRMPHPLLITSDNPSVLTVLPALDGSYGPFFLPVSPNELMVAIDRSRYRFLAPVGTDADAYFAGFYSAAQRNRFVFYSAELTESQRTDLWTALSRAPLADSARGRFEANRFVPGHPIYGVNRPSPFSFLETL